MAETDLQLGGGYTYQWECAILLALNYFFEPVRYNSTLFDLVSDFLGQVAEIHLEGEDRESGVNLEDINLVSGDRRILIQVKAKQAEGGRWTPTDPLLLKALYRFYNSRFFVEQPEDTRFVFLTNRPFNPDLVQVKTAIKKGTVAQCAEADKLCERLDRYARKEKKGESIDADRFREMLARTVLVEYLAVDEVKANVQAKLQAHGRRDWEQAYAVLFEHFARQSTRIGGDTVTRASVIEVLGPPPVAEKAALTPEERQELTRTYLDKIADDCRYVEPKDLKIRLTEVFVMLQAVERKCEEPLREDFAPLEEREREAGFLDRPFTRRKPGEAEKMMTRERPAPPPPPVELSKALQEHDHLVLLGEPGAGKTTTLQYIALLLAEGREGELGLGDDLIPVRLNLREHEEGFGEWRLDEFLKDRLHKYYVSPEQTNSWLEEGRLILLFDALDEVRPEKHQLTVLEAIGNFTFTPEGKRTRIILSSRLPAYRATTGISGDFGHYIVCPFTKPEETLPYATKWFMALGKIPTEEAERRAQELLNDIQKQPGLRRVTSNPLLLRLAIEVYLREGEAVSSRAELYGRYIEETWKRARLREAPSVWKVDVKTEQEEREALKTAMETIAWKIFVEGECGKEALCQAVEEKLTVNDHKKVDGAKLVEYLRRAMGLLVLHLGEREQELLLFSHFSFCEYSVALHLVKCWGKDEKRTWRFLKPRLHHPAWQEPIIILAGALDEKEAKELARRILHARSPYEPFLHRDLFLLAALIGHGAKVGEGNAQKLCRRIVPLLRLRNFDRMEQVAESLLEVGTPAVPYLIAVLRDKDPDVRWKAAEVLGKIGCAEAVPHLIAALEDERWYVREAARVALLIAAMEDEDGSVHGAAAAALGKLKVQETVPHLIAALGNENAWVRHAAAKALGELKAQEAMLLLMVALWDEREAVAVLGKLKVEEAISHLIVALGDENAWVRQAAANALRELTYHEAVLLMMKVLLDVREAAVAPLIAALEDEDGSVRGAAVLGRIGKPAVLHLIVALRDRDRDVREVTAAVLGGLKAQEAVPYLIAALEDKDGSVRGAAMEALGRIGKPAVPHLIEALRDRDKGVREAAAMALMWLEAPEAVPYLIAALEDGDGFVRGAAAAALGKLNPQGAVPHLIEALRDRDEGVREAAAQALWELEAPEAVPHLIAALRDENAWVRQKAVAALERTGQPAIPHLIEALRDRDEGVREAAARALRWLGAQGAVPHLIAVLRDRDKGVRKVAAVALTELRAQGAVPHLIEALRDRDEGVREAAAQALGKLKAQGAMPHLIAALEDEDGFVRGAAAAALGELKAPEAVPHLIAALEDGDGFVRGAAAAALGELKVPEAVPHLIAALRDRDKLVCWTAVAALEKSAEEVDLSQARYLASFTVWGPLSLKRLLSVIIVRSAWACKLLPTPLLSGTILGSAWDAFPQQAVSRITDLEVAALPAEDPYAMPGRDQWKHVWSYALYVVIAALGGLISDLVAGALGERYEVSRGWRLAAVGAAFVFVLAAGVAVELFWRSRAEARKPPG